MRSSRGVSDAQMIEKLAEGLAEVPEVRRFDRPSEPQASTLAHALVDIERSCFAITEQRMPDLLSVIDDPEGALRALVDIGEELAHILYHVRDANFYRYVIERVDGAAE